MAQPVGIVLVSHSAPLATGLRDLLLAVGGGAAVVETAGGDAEGGLGTSEALIGRAVARADRGAGVLVLADLGSAVLTTRAVLAEWARQDVVLADAPFVEGAVAAAALAAAGAPLSEVGAAAAEAWHARKL